MRKEIECLSLTRRGGYYVARLYHKRSGYFLEHRFLDYTKREVVARLRSLGVIVPRGI